MVFLLILDEVGALVFDIGSYSFRAGFAGEDTPKVGSVYGYRFHINYTHSSVLQDT